MNYEDLLQPELYDDPDVARFVETLVEPEIASASYDQIQRLQQEMMATDDINDISDQLISEACSTIVQTGTLPPQFIGYLDAEQRIKFKPEQIPTTTSSVKRFLHAGKAMGMSRAAQCMFFMAMQPLSNNAPVFGDNVRELSPWGVLVIGSSLRGNCFIHIKRMIKKEDIAFETVCRQISRDGQYHYPYSRLFHIDDEDEMSSIVKQLLKPNTIPEKECLINFATTLKALDFFGYSTNCTS